MRQATYILIALVAVGCAPSDPRSPLPDDTNTPPPGTEGSLFAAAPELTPSPYPQAPLVQVLTVRTVVPTRLEIGLEDAAGRAHTLLREALATEHSVDLLELGADASWQITVVARDEQGDTQASEPLPCATPPLPLDFPQLRLVVSKPERMEPGLTLVHELSADDRDLAYLIAVDAEGGVAWYAESPSAEPISELHQTSRGTLRMQVASPGDRAASHVYEVDMRGVVVTHYMPAAAAEPGAIPLDLLALHHDVQPAPDDGLFLLSVHAVDVPLYPTDELDRSAPWVPATIKDDLLAEIGPDGTVRDTWAMSDLLDSARIGRDSVWLDHWSDFFGGQAYDWAHVNAVHYVPEQDAFLLSSRHQDAVFQVGRTSRELEWILAPHANWSTPLTDKLLHPVDPDVLFSYHQHAPRYTPDGTILMFDNGNYRASAFEQADPVREWFSRAVEVAVDPVTGTFEEVWSYGAEREPALFSPTVGDTDRLPQTDNTLIVFGNVPDSESGNRATWHVVEVTHDQPAEVVFELLSPARRVRRGLNRVERVASLYPPG